MVYHYRTLRNNEIDECLVHWDHILECSATWDKVTNMKL